jgi:hypothetical protein
MGTRARRRTGRDAQRNMTVTTLPHNLIAQSPVAHWVPHNHAKCLGALERLEAWG